MNQLAIELPFRPALGRADFLVSDCNAAALARIDSWPGWLGRALVLHGPSGSGKTHLAHLWRERSGGMLTAGEALAAHDPSALAANSAAGAACHALAGDQLYMRVRLSPISWARSLSDRRSATRNASTPSLYVSNLTARVQSVPHRHRAMPKASKIRPSGSQMSL